MSIKKDENPFSRASEIVSFFFNYRFTVYDSRTNRLLRPERKITVGYQGLPNDFTIPDAAFIFPRNNKLYLFKGNSWQFLSYFMSMMSIFFAKR